MKQRIRGVQGGTSASKTISILLYLIHLAQSDKAKTLTSVISESIPHLKRGSIRDFRNIMTDHHYWKDDLWNATDSIYTFETGSQMEFFSSDNGDKLRGARRDRLFINEANNVTFDAFNQLEVRTKDFVYLDWNPSNEFWFYTDVLGKRTDVEKIILTYRDNEALSTEIVASIEQRKNNASWWKVYGLGELGEVDGKIYKDWQIIDEIPHEARLERRGLDFGYTNDPSALVDIYYWNGGYILDEQMFRKGMTNKQIADIILNLPMCLTIADSAEPKSIDEIKSYGVQILPAKKGQGSVAQGIQFVQGKRISVTKRSVNVIQEYRNYLWKTDKSGIILNEPDHLYSHCFAPWARVRTINGWRTIESLVGTSGFLITKDGRIARYRDVRETRKDADILNIHFTDGNTLSVTPDHLLLMPDGVWKEARLLGSVDRIQSVTYDCNIVTNNTGISWEDFYKTQRVKILQGIHQWSARVFAQSCLGISQRKDTAGFSYSSYGQRCEQQYVGQFGTKESSGSSQRTHDGRKACKSKRMGKDNYTTHKEMAWVKRGDKVAQATWEDRVFKTCCSGSGVFTLPQKILHKTTRIICEILRKQLQNESATKTIKGITRGFCPITYNLDVDDVYCLLVDGVIAHNSMDAIRYGFNDFFESDDSLDTNFNLYGQSFS